MQRKLLGALFCCIGALSLAETKPCLIFSGTAEKECALDLSQYNRISFGETSMMASNSKDSNDKIELLYSAYHHLEIGLRDTQQSDIDDVNASYFSLSYEAASKSLKIDASADDSFAVGVFNLKGTLVCHTQLNGGESVSLESLTEGVYIAVATGESSSQKIKFIK